MYLLKQANGKNKMNIAKNISGIKWSTALGMAVFHSQKAYGVLNSEGQALSADGVKPATYISMKVAKEMAGYADGFIGYSWVDLH